MDGRAMNTGRPDSLPSKIEAARDTAPDSADTIQITSVGYTAYQTGRDPVDVWQEVDKE